MYTAVVLDDISRNSITHDFHNWITLPKHWVKKAHHVTLNMGPLDDELNDSSILGEVCHINTDKYYLAYDEGIIALGVTNMYISLGHPIPLDVEVNSINKHPHITMYHHPDVAPKKSNDVMATCKRVTPFKFRLTGKVKVINK